MSHAYAPQSMQLSTWKKARAFGPRSGNPASSTLFGLPFTCDHPGYRDHSVTPESRNIPPNPIAVQMQGILANKDGGMTHLHDLLWSKCSCAAATWHANKGITACRQQIPAAQ